MLTTIKKQRGLSIVEVLVGITIGLVIATAILGVFTSAITSNQRVIETGKLDRDLGSIMDVITADVQRAGYWSKATTSHTNPFMQNMDDLTTTSNCIVYTYDKNDNGVVDSNERFGFRKSGDAIQYREPSNTLSCTDGTWTNLTDPNVIMITAFAVSLTKTSVDIDDAGPGTATTDYRKVTITLTGHLTNDSATSKTITRTINLYNNKYSP